MVGHENLRTVIERFQNIIVLDFPIDVQPLKQKFDERIRIGPRRTDFGQQLIEFADANQFLDCRNYKRIDLAFRHANRPFREHVLVFAWQIAHERAPAPRRQAWPANSYTPENTPGFTLQTHWSILAQNAVDGSSMNWPAPAKHLIFYVQFGLNFGKSLNRLTSAAPTPV